MVGYTTPTVGRVVPCHADLLKKKIKMMMLIGNQLAPTVTYAASMDRLYGRLEQILRRDGIAVAPRAVAKRCSPRELLGS